MVVANGADGEMKDGDSRLKSAVAADEGKLYPGTGE